MSYHKTKYELPEGIHVARNLTGEYISRYQLGKVVAIGGMGVVWKAYQADLKRDVAIKVIGRNMLRHPEAVERFQREALATARLQHPHILPIYDVGEHEGLPYIVMAYVDGGTLSQLIKVSPEGLPLDIVVQIATEISSALDYAHSQGIVHRDVKPGNILFDKEGHAYLADFGLAWNSAEGRYTSGTGTFSYLAPEVANGEQATPSSDIFSFGATLFEALAGRRFTTAKTLDDLLAFYDKKIVPDVNLYRRDLPTGVGVALWQALAHSPEARPHKTTALVSSIARAARMPAVHFPKSLAAPRPEDKPAGLEAQLHTPPVEEHAAPAKGEVPVLATPNPPRLHPGNGSRSITMTSLPTPPQVEQKPQPSHSTTAAILIGISLLVVVALFLLIAISAGGR